MELEGVLVKTGVVEYWSDGVVGRSPNTEAGVQDRGNGVLEYWSGGVMGTSHNTETRAQDRGNYWTTGVVE